MKPWQAFELGYVTLEFTSAFRVGAAEGDNLFDAVFVTDANGLPCIPGESLAGVLRHSLGEDNRCDEVFGFQDREGGEASRVRFSFAHVHNSKNQPVPFRGATLKDPVLELLAAGAGRDHVRIGAHGAADGRGKFDELVVPAGARFTFELSVSHLSPMRLDELVGRLDRSEVRLGGGTRNGLGNFRVVALRAASFNLAHAKDLERLTRLPVALEKAALSEVLETRSIEKQAAPAGWSEATITLTPLSTWMIGGGAPTTREPEPSRPEQGWDRVPLTEGRVEWDDKGTGRVRKDKEAPFLIPASSIKGAVRHRTAFHARRLAGAWLESGGLLSPTDADQLFGGVRGNSGGVPGKVHFSEVYVKPSEVDYIALQHVSLDRFTQGPRDHLLFDELALGSTRLVIRLQVHKEVLSEGALQALEAALDDLCQSRLALGAGRGHGRFRGEWGPRLTAVKEEREHARL